LKALLAARPGAERLMHLIDALGAIEEWRSFEMAPKDWIVQCGCYGSVSSGCAQFRVSLLSPK